MTYSAFKQRRLLIHKMLVQILKPVSYHIKHFYFAIQLGFPSTFEHESQTASTTTSILALMDSPETLLSDGEGWRL